MRELDAYAKAAGQAEQFRREAIELRHNIPLGDTEVQGHPLDAWELAQPPQLRLILLQEGDGIQNLTPQITEIGLTYIDHEAGRFVNIDPRLERR